MNPRVLLVLVILLASCSNDGSWVTVSDFASQNVAPLQWQFSYVIHDGAHYNDNPELQLLADAVYNPQNEDVAFPDAGFYKGAWLRLALTDGEEEVQPFGEVLLLKKDDWFNDRVGSFGVGFDRDGNLLHSSEQVDGAVRVQFTIERFKSR